VYKRQARNNVDAMKLIGAEFAATVREHLAHDKADRELYPFPAPDDSRWRREWITPLVPDATIHKDHRFSDAVKLNKPCATINPEGEEIMLIVADEIDAVMVMKDDCWGYLPKRFVRIGK